MQLVVRRSININKISYDILNDMNIRASSVTNVNIRVGKKDFLEGTWYNIRIKNSINASSVAKNISIIIL